MWTHSAAVWHPQARRPAMSIVSKPDSLKQQIQQIASQLCAFIEVAAHDGKRVDEVEEGVWQQMLQLGGHCMTHFFALIGNGDMGETVRSDDGREWQRLEGLHTRRYV